MKRTTNITDKIIEVDGAEGEGGGQVLRTCLALSAVTGRAFHIRNIRGNRRKPGLMRQHLACVRAAAEVCGATTSGPELRATELEFVPGKVKGGCYTFDIGSAGSTHLVLQTVLWPLAFASCDSVVSIKGGTHNDMAPPYEFIRDAFLPQLERVGVRVEADISSYGFVPAGGGQVTFAITATDALKPLNIVERGAFHGRSAYALVAHIAGGQVAEREIHAVNAKLGWSGDDVRPHAVKSIGPGNALILTVEFQRATEVATAFGRKGRSAGKVAGEAIEQMQRYLASSAPVSEHLADQLIIPLALAGGRFIATTASSHLRTNIEVCARFLDRPIRVVELADGAVEVSAPTFALESQVSGLVRLKGGG